MAQLLRTRLLEVVMAAKAKAEAEAGAAEPWAFVPPTQFMGNAMLSVYPPGSVGFATHTDTAARGDLRKVRGRREPPEAELYIRLRFAKKKKPPLFSAAAVARAFRLTVAPTGAGAVVCGVLPEQGLGRGVRRRASTQPRACERRGHHPARDGPAGVVLVRPNGAHRAAHVQSRSSAPRAVVLVPARPLVRRRARGGIAPP